METEQNTIGLSNDFIIHPGETLAEVLKDRKMSQKELAIRTRMTENILVQLLVDKKIYHLPLQTNWNMH